MTVAVSSRRGIPDPTGLVIGSPVAAARQWSEIAATANWLKGKGASLVPAFAPMVEVKTTAEQIFRFRVKPRTSAVQRIWVVSAYMDTGGAFVSSPMEVRVPATSGTVLNASVDQLINSNLAAIYTETLSAKSSTTEDLSIGLTFPEAGATNTVFVKLISCYEQDRPLLTEDATDLPVLTETVRTDEPIGSATRSSLAGALATMAASDARRVGIYHMSRPDAISRVSATPASIFVLLPYVQGPKGPISATKHEVRWAAFASMSSGGGSGSVDLSTTVSGASATIAVSSATPAWIDGGVVDISCDDFSQVDGAAGDQLDIQIAGDGTRSVQLYAVSMWVEAL